MNTNTFKVTYASGLESEMTTDDATVEAFCNSHFGSTWPAAQENGATVEMTAGVDAGRLEAEKLAAAQQNASALALLNVGAAQGATVPLTTLEGAQTQA